MHFERYIQQPGEERAEVDASGLQRELEEARKMIRDLQRQARKARAQYEEIQRAYTMTVANLVKTTSRCSMLEQERERWQRYEEIYEAPPSFNTGPLTLSDPELAAIRKAMARLHHPDVGGDVERMKAWNTLLDRLENDR